MAANVRFEGIHCAMTIERPATGVVVVAYEGVDSGELGDLPFRELASDLEGEGMLELFIDARATRTASLDVSSEWAAWFARHRERFVHISMLTGSRFIQLTADLVRRFSDLGDRMRIYTDPVAFDGALSNAVGNATAARDRTPR